MSDLEGDVAVVTETKQKLQRPKKYNVVFYNDDVTPMDFVVKLLVEVFGHTQDTAVFLMYDVHHAEKAIVGTFSKEVAVEKVKECERRAFAAKHPLVARAETTD